MCGLEPTDGCGHEEKLTYRVGMDTDYRYQTLYEKIGDDPTVYLEARTSRIRDRIGETMEKSLLKGKISQLSEHVTENFIR